MMLRGCPQPQCGRFPCHSQHADHRLQPHAACVSILLLQVDGNDVAWVPSASGGPFKRVDTRSFMVRTTDLMSFYYVTLPKGVRGGGVISGEGAGGKGGEGVRGGGRGQSGVGLHICKLYTGGSVEPAIHNGALTSHHLTLLSCRRTAAPMGLPEATNKHQSRTHLDSHTLTFTLTLKLRYDTTPLGCPAAILLPHQQACRKPPTST
jgi:hypothetical protein